MLYRSERTRVLRVTGPDGGSVIRKEFVGADAVLRARRESDVLDRLSGTAGVVRTAGAAEPGVLLLQDCGDTTLARHAAATPAGLGVPELLELGRRLALVVAGVHRAGVVHKDLNPANVMLLDGEPVLIDFELATTAAEERPGFTHESMIVGTLPYLAPEQTGRTGRAVDHRSDLYALGATLYELAAGRPPFGRGEPLRLIHDHLARVPEPADAVNPGIPPALAAVIARLLEKEPDRRYQSAEGLAYDLQRAGGETFPLGERDFAARLAPPSRLVGRDTERDRLREAFARAARGGSPAVLVTGPPGVGKTSLIDELRPAVTAAGGWLVTGKFDQYRTDAHTDAVSQALQALGRLLLAEPEESLTALRERVREQVGANAPLITALVPELGTLLGVAAGAAPDDHAEAQARLFAAGTGLLRAVVSAERPVVMVVDDLQWAAATPIAFLEKLVEERVAGLLLVGAYRDAELDPAHPFTGLLDRWARSPAGPSTLSLTNLPPGDITALLAEMLRLPAGRAGELAAAVGAHTAGNPFDTVEFVNALRRDGLLVAESGGWSWDPAAVRTYVGDGDVVHLLSARIAQLPRPARQLVKVMACLGGDVDLTVLLTAYPVPDRWLGGLLEPALRDGLITSDDTAVRFRHDRVQQAAYSSLGPTGRRLMHLVLARRLRRGAWEPQAAQQYLAAYAVVRDRTERLDAARLLRTTAADLKVVNQVMAERYLSAALELVADDDQALRSALLTDRHRALCDLGRLTEADELYREIERRADPVEIAAAAPAQITGLTVRGRPQEAVELGLGVLRGLGIDVPGPQDVGAEVERGLDRLRDWVQRASVPADVERPELTDPRLTAAAGIILRMMPASFFGAQTTMGWLVVTAHRLWAEHGPNPQLIGSVGHAGIVTNVFRADYRTGYQTLRHVTAVGQARGWAAETAVGKFLASVSTTHWFEPLENGIDLARQAREELLRAGDLQFAVATFHTSVPSSIDCASDLGSYVAEVHAGVALAARTGNEQAAATTFQFRDLVRVLLGQPPTPGFDSTAYEAGRDGNPMAVAYDHTTKAIAAAIFGDRAALREHAAAAYDLIAYIGASYSTSTVYLLRALADGPEPERRDARDWLAARAADAPDNFRHLVHFADAELAWTAGDHGAALRAFDDALTELGERCRPWHGALIAERAARLHRDRGREYHGRRLLAEAYERYSLWGATAKLRVLERAHPFLRSVAPRRRGPAMGHSTTLAAQDLDLMGVLTASRALSSETRLDRLRDRVTEILGTLTGAGHIRMLVREGDRWVLPAEAGSPAVALEEAEALLPLTAVRYVQRTREPLLVPDAVRDDRFARDPYLAGVEFCSLLILPVLIQGTPLAVLVLENRLARSAFTADRLDAVQLIAGQLAVSIENARVYASLEATVAERTEELRRANDQLQVLSSTDALTGLANRRQLDSRLDAAWQYGAERHEPLSIAMIDVDHFKLYNDHYGHPAGDACLRRVAEALSGVVRGTDLVARYGGEEFALILPGADGPTALAIAERARAAVLALGEVHAAAPSGLVTVSIGVASLVPGPQDDPQTLVLSADAELYQAKQGGRNRVVMGVPVR